MKKRYFDLLKWLIGTIGLGGAGILINFQIQKTELKIKRIGADATLLEVVTDDIEFYSSSNEASFKYLSFIRTFITSDEIKKNVDSILLNKKKILEKNGRDRTDSTNLLQEQEYEAIDKVKKERIKRLKNRNHKKRKKALIHF